MTCGPSHTTPLPTTRTAAACSGVPILTNVPTDRLRVGDLITTHGMHVRLGARREYGNTQVPGGTVWRFDGTVENLPDVLAAGVVPASYLYQWDTAGSTIVRRDHWGVQGSTAATWSVLERGPAV